MAKVQKSVDIWHNILWSKYKAYVFSELNRKLIELGIEANFYQIAETDSQRSGLSGVDYTAHRYPYYLLFPGSLSQVGLLKLVGKVSAVANRSSAKVVLIAGYDRLEYWAQLIIAKMKRQKVGVFCDSTGFDREPKIYKTWAKRFFFAQSDRVFCYGARARDYVMSFGVQFDKIVNRCQAAALPASYIIEDIPEKRVAARSDAKKRFLYVGRLSKEKNIDLLIKAFSLYLKLHPNAELNIVGSGPEELTLKELAVSSGCSFSVHFLGSRDSGAISEEYLRASVMVLPSVSEPWGLVVNESLSYACPVVVCERCGCVPELVLDGFSGYSFRAGDVHDLMEKLVLGEKLSRNIDVTTRNCLSVMARFTPDIAASQVADGIEQLLSL